MELNEIPDTVSGWLWIHLPGANVADKGHYPYRPEGKQDIKAFPFDPYIFDEGENREYRFLRKTRREQRRF